MGMIVQHNMNALNAYNKLNANVAGLKKSSEKLSSGYRINRAGDDAAGLAISEKMRSQIRGLNQAVRNSQDGINMIQTYEGAAQESHSILQRMKELASEAATGTYQNEVDRDAIQLEFNQLNDELNQIADTDFNGVAMLNGGQMADGRKAVNGKFDYVDGPLAPSKLGKGDVTLLDSQVWDDPNADGSKTIADEAWAQLNTGWTRTAGDTTTYGPDSVDVTFKFNSGDGNWTVTGASNGADKSKITVAKSENGGFDVKINDVVVTTVVLDQTKLANGDEITLTFNNPAKGIDAPTKAGASIADKTQFTEGSGDRDAIAKGDENLVLTLKDQLLKTGVGQDANMTKDVQALIDALNGATLDINFSNAATANKDFTLNLKNGTSLTFNANTQKATIGDTEFSFTYADGKITIKDANDAEYLEIDATAFKQTADTKGGVNSTGKLTFNIAVEAGKYDDAAKPTVEVKSAGSVSRSDSYKQATAPLTYTDNLTLQVGARTKDSVNFSFEYSTDGMGDLKANLDISSRENGLNTANLTLATQEDANYAIDRIDNAINKVSMVRATFGATQNRLEHKITNLTTTSENIQEAESAIRDTDMASEMMNYTKFNILQQAAQSMLAQANQQPQSILQLLG